MSKLVPISEESEPLKDAWEHLEGIRRVELAAVLYDLIVSGAVIVDVGVNSLNVAQMLLDEAQKVCGSRIIEIEVVINDELNTPVLYIWQAHLKQPWREEMLHNRQLYRRRQE